MTSEEDIEEWRRVKGPCAGSPALTHGWACVLPVKVKHRRTRLDGVAYNFTSSMKKPVPKCANGIQH